jgi:hypothetical protein
MNNCQTCGAPGSVSGVVSADCPEPGTLLHGVTVDIFDDEGMIAGSAATDEFGFYEIADLEAGDYTATIVTPLGYSTSAEEVQVTVTAGSTVAVDFSLTCLDIVASARSMGFWKHQVGVATGGKGHAQIDAATLCEYLDLIEVHFNSNEINPVAVYIPPSSGLCDDKLDVASDLLNLKGSVAMIARARQQLLALLFNVAGGKISLTEVISEDGASVSQAITYCDNLVDDPEGDHELAKTIADDINNGREVAAGVIPLETPGIAYSRPVDRSGAVLVYAFPNPSDGAMRIFYSVPAPGARIVLEVYDVAGRCVKRLVAGQMNGGSHQVIWHGDDESGRPVGAGVYFYRLQVGGRSATRRAVLLR